VTSPVMPRSHVMLDCDDMPRFGSDIE
jgi:hypothetical protein